MRIPSGYLYRDTPISILCLDTLFPKTSGAAQKSPYLRFPRCLSGLARRRAKRNLSSTPRRSSKRCSSTPLANLNGTESKPSPEAAASRPLFQKAVASAVSVRCSCPALSRSAHRYLARPGLPHRRAHRCIKLADAREFQAGVPDTQINAPGAPLETFPVFRKTILEGLARRGHTDAVGAGSEGGCGRER